MNTTVKITDHARPAMRALEFALKNGAANPAIGQLVAKLVRKHLLGLPANERKFPTTHFWQRAAEATTFQATRHSVQIIINQIGVRQRYSGGGITPIRAKFLTIPAIAETYGHRAGDFGDLKVVRGPFWTYWGSQAPLALVPRNWDLDQHDEDDAYGVYFWLVRGVFQAGNPAVLPDDDEIIAFTRHAVRKYYENAHAAN